jgi:hypothetical protein
VSDTVKIEVIIRIDAEGEVDTGIPIETWNAMTDQERDAVARNLWDLEAGNHDAGGMTVTTDGAEGI